MCVGPPSVVVFDRRLTLYPNQPAGASNEITGRLPCRVRNANCRTLREITPHECEAVLSLEQGHHKLPPRGPWHGCCLSLEPCRIPLPFPACPRSLRGIRLFAGRRLDLLAPPLDVPTGVRFRAKAALESRYRWGQDRKTREDGRVNRMPPAQTFGGERCRSDFGAPQKKPDHPPALEVHASGLSIAPPRHFFPSVTTPPPPSTGVRGLIETVLAFREVDFLGERQRRRPPVPTTEDESVYLQAIRPPLLKQEAGLQVACPGNAQPSVPPAIRRWRAVLRRRAD